MPEPEALARIDIDRQLEAAGWVVQDRSKANLDVFWLRNKSLDDAASLEIVSDIIENLKTALAEIPIIYYADPTHSSDMATGEVTN